jgi:rhodanese-related sulfurtransferase
MAVRAILLVDIREPEEYVAERIDGAALYPLSSFNLLNLARYRPSKI